MEPDLRVFWLVGAAKVHVAGSDSVDGQTFRE